MTNDLMRLQDWGVNIPTGAGMVDTACLERAYSGRVNGRKVSLQGLCEGLEVKYYRRDKLRNAGNDAFFTMAAFIEMCCVPGQH